MTAPVADRCFPGFNIPASLKRAERGGVHRVVRGFPGFNIPASLKRECDTGAPAAAIGFPGFNIPASLKLHVVHAAWPVLVRFSGV